MNVKWSALYNSKSYASTADNFEWKSSGHMSSKGRHTDVDATSLRRSPSRRRHYFDMCPLGLRIQMDKNAEPRTCEKTKLWFSPGFLVFAFTVGITGPEMSNIFAQRYQSQPISQTITYRGLTSGFLLLRIFSVAISISPHVCFTLDLILISMFLR